MTTSTKKYKQIYGEYINPTIDQYSLQKENPLVLMAQACNNIGKELISSSSPPPPLRSSKQRKSNSPPEGKKSLKRIAPTSCLSPSTKKFSVPPSSFMFDSLFYQYLNKTFSSPIFDFSTSPFNYSSFSPSFDQSSYLMDSILSLPFVCNWMNSINSDGFCGKRFPNHTDLLKHLCTEHTSIKSSYPSYYSSTSIQN